MLCPLLLHRQRNTLALAVHFRNTHHYVTNITNFGAFVDVGVHQDGLVHISQVSNKFIRHPSEVVSVGDIVKVTVLDVDEKKKRISLSMKQAN